MALEIARRLVPGFGWRTGPVEEDGGASPGGSQPENVRLLDLGTITSADLATGPVTLYTPSAGELVGPVYLADVEFVVLGGKSIQITRPEQLDPDVTRGFPPLASWDSDLVRDGGTWPGDEALGTPISSGVVTAAFASGYNTLAAGMAWQANHAYATNAQAVIVEAGHLWEGNAGTSAGSEPDFVGNIGGSVLDNDIEWFDVGEIAAAAGSARALAQVATPAAP